MRFFMGFFKFIAWVWLIINGFAIGFMLWIPKTKGDTTFLPILSNAVILIILPIVFLLWRHIVDKENKKYKGLNSQEIKEKKLEEEIAKAEPEIIDGKKVYRFTTGGLAPVFVIMDGNWLNIKREGIFNALNHGLDGAKKIHIKSISAVQFKEASSIVTEGYIQLVIQGSIESKGGLYAARTDENTVMFGPAYNKLAKNLVGLIENKIDELQCGHVNEVVMQPETQSVVQQLKDFKELLDSGIITQEEFDKKKAQLLS